MTQTPSRQRTRLGPVATATALLCAALASPAAAQSHEREPAGREAPRANAPAAPHGPPPRAAPAPAYHAGGGSPPPYSGPGRVQGAAPPRGPDAYENRHGAYPGPGRPGPGGYSGPGGSPGYGHGGGTHQWQYRGEFHPGYRLSPFRYPSGWSYRSWRIGERLPFLFLTSYYFLDYYAYDLPPPPYGYRWVRYGPDALLVNIYTGEVEDVVYGIFYW